jgi:uncharacterized protein YutE (UPF0331/DUF86 family)
LIDREIVATRLSKLREALRSLQPIAAKPRDEYLASPTHRALAEHFLRIALESVLDTGNHVIAARGFRKPLVLRDIPTILGENGIISAELAGKLTRAAGLRNRLVHGYADIDHETLHGVLQTDLRDLEAFAAAVAALVA